MLAPVSWELLESQEGNFDFSLVDALVEGARTHQLRLVLLWFGSWKNSMSCYAPAWVKASQDRFPRAEDAERWPRAGGLILETEPNEYLIAGSGIIVTFTPRGPGDPTAGIVSVEEGSLANGTWIPGRRLNGDQTHQGRHLRIPFGQFGVQRIRLCRYR